MVYQGRCHCGAIGFSFSTERPPEDWKLRACQCTFCRAHGARTTSDPGGSVEYFSDAPEHLQRYRFGHGITEFLLCRLCGVYVGAVTEVASTLLTVINSNALMPHPPDLTDALPVSHDGESVEARNRRRRSAWTPCRGIVARVRPP